MAFEGMDVDAVRGLASRLDNEAGTIQSVIGQINSIVNDLEQNWRGQDAIQFRDWWTSQHQPALQHAHDAISGLAQSARNNASQQESASNN